MPIYICIICKNAFILTKMHGNKFLESINNKISVSYTHLDVYKRQVITPHEAHLGKRPTRAWEKWLDKEIIDIKGSSNINLFVKIKEKREKYAKRINDNKKITKFAIGDKVHQSDAAMKKIDKVFELYAGPYKINRVFGDATYELVDCDNSNRIRGKFNVR